MNPIHVMQKGNKSVLKKGESVLLRDGDSFTLLPNKFRFKVELERELPSDDDATEPLDSIEGSLEDADQCM